VNPVSLRPLLESLIVVEELRPRTQANFRGRTGLTERRSSEILSSLDALGLVSLEKERISLTSKGSQTVAAMREQHWRKIDDALCSESAEYRAVRNALSARKGSGLAISEMKSIVGLNQVVCETCLEWGLRLGRFQKNLYTTGRDSRYYALTGDVVSIEEFERGLRSSYLALNVSSGFRRSRYVGIARLREVVCEALRLGREEFDERLGEVCLTKLGAIELAGGPLTSTVRTTPTAEQSLTVNMDLEVPIPKLLTTVKEGFKMRGRVYQTLAMLN